MTELKTICVFCGSSHGAKPEYDAAAGELGELLAEADIGLVYGGGSVGLMGTVARTVLANGGSVTGVIPRALATKELMLTEATDIRIVASMHERKALMAELSDGFMALPGGIGTLEELFEVFTWAQLGFHEKPCGLLNTAGYYDHMLGFLDHMAGEEFVKRENLGLVLVDHSPRALIEKMRTYKPLPVKKWLGPDET